MNSFPTIEKNLHPYISVRNILFQLKLNLFHELISNLSFMRFLKVGSLDNKEMVGVTTLQLH